MSQKKIEKLTPQQEALIPVYGEKWRSIAISTEQIDRQKAAEAIKAAYAAIGFEEPEIIFCESPDAACEILFLRGKAGSTTRKVEGFSPAMRESL